MTRKFQTLELFVFSCLFLTVESKTDQILQPQNVSLLWISGFEPQMSWAPPHSAENCTYEVESLTTNNDEDKVFYTVEQPFWKAYVVMEGGSLHLTVKTLCNGRKSTPAVINITYPELVRDLQCYIYSSKQTHCSWIPASHATDLHFFYELVNEDQTISIDSSSHAQTCSSYSYTDGFRTGCDLQANMTQDIHILFNGMLNNILVKNTFKKALDVRPPPMKWTVTKSGDKFIISWNPPDIADPSQWKFIINYTECGEIKIKVIFERTSSTELALDPRCQYRMTIKAQLRGFTTPWSEEKCFDPDSNWLVYAAIVIPLIFAGLAALTFVCLRNNKDKIFPKIPEPRDLLSDISDNNNKSTVGNLYIPAEEEDNCKITLVIDHPKQQSICGNDQGTKVLITQDFRNVSPLPSDEE